MKNLQPNDKRLIYGIALAIGLLWIWFSAAPAEATTGGKIPAPQKGFLAPNFSLSTLDGQTVTLSDLRGKAVLVNVWASWCPPCRAEMPAIESTYQDFKDRGFVVLAVHSTSQDTVAAAQAFVDDNGLTFIIPIDINGEVARLYRVQSLPTSFFIGPDGVIREVIIGGPMAEALLRSRIEELLKEMP